MSQHSLKLIKLTTMKPQQNEQDTFFTNIDGSVMRVFNAPIIRALSQGLGIPIEIVKPLPDAFGIKYPNGTWSGVIGMLLRGEADLTGSGLTPTNERREVVNFTFPLYVSEVSFMTNKPEPHPKSFAVFQTFAFEVWIGIVLSLTLVSICLYILLKKRQPYSKVLMTAVGNLLEKSTSLELRRKNTALLLLFWFLGCTILINSYKAVILSVITFPRMVGIRDISDLAKAAKEGSVTCISYKGGIQSVRWFESDNERFRPIGECLKQSEMAGLHGKAPFLDYSYKKAFIADRLDLYVHARDYFISEASFSLSHIGIAYSKNFCCPRKLESIVHRIVAADLYAKNLRDRRYMTQLRLPERKNPAYDRTGISPLTLEDLTGAFLVLSIGHMLAFLVLVVEILVNKNNIRKVNRETNNIC